MLRLHALRRQEYSWQQPRRRWRSSCRLADHFFRRHQRERFVCVCVCLGRGPLRILNWFRRHEGRHRACSRAVRTVCKAPRLAVSCSSSGSSRSHSSSPQCRLHCRLLVHVTCRVNFAQLAPFPPLPLLSTCRPKFAQRICTAEEIRKPTGACILLEHIKSSPGQPVTTGSCAATSTKRARFVVAPVALEEEACKLCGTWNIFCVCARVCPDCCVIELFRVNRIYHVYNNELFLCT